MIALLFKTLCTNYDNLSFYQNEFNILIIYLAQTIYQYSIKQHNFLKYNIYIHMRCWSIIQTKDHSTFHTHSSNVTLSEDLLQDMNYSIESICIL